MANLRPGTYSTPNGPVRVQVTGSGYLIHHADGTTTSIGADS